MQQNNSSAAKQKYSVVSQDDWSEFIPYHSHYNPHTLVTKNGELLQIIRIDGNVIGSPCENLDGIHASIRSVVRHVISKSGFDDKFSFWLQTIRRRTPMLYNAPVAGEKNTNDFIEYLDECWEKENRWQHHYQNEIYLTVLYEGETIPLVDTKSFKNLVLTKHNRSTRSKYLADASVILDQQIDSIMQMLSTQCRAHRLTLVERAISSTGKVSRPNIFYSEPMEFLSNVLNLRSSPVPLSDLDLSVAVQNSKVSFGFNAIEAKNKTNDIQSFAAILTVKQYIESFVEAVDCVMQAPIEFIVTQSFSFIDSEKALKPYKDQKTLFGMSGDIKLNKNFGINQVLNFNQKSPTDYCANQVSIMVISGDLNELDEEVAKFLNSFSQLGLITVREDIKMEEVFWSQLPGNFEFIRRPVALATEQVGGFCRLNRFHSGVPTGNYWGNYLALLPTSVGSPYFFNFHVQDNGHTVIFDFNSFSDSMGSILEYFLVVKTRKSNAKLIIFDRNQSARLLLNKISGKYFTMSQLNKHNKNAVVDKTPPVSLNPFIIEPSNYNKSFLTAWCGLLISPETGLEPGDKALVAECVAKLYELESKERNLPNFVKILEDANNKLSEPLKKWVGKGEYSGLFDSLNEGLNTNLEVAAFDMTPAVNNPAYLLPLFSYLMHRVISSLDGTKTVLVINEAFDLLENPFFAPRLESLLEMLKQKNVVVVFTTNRPQQCKGTIALSAIISGCATKIYIPDDMPVNYKSHDIDLNDQDDILLSDMQRQKGDFLIKQNGESIALKLFMSEAEDLVAILSNDIKALGSARGKFTSLPEDY